MADQEIIKIIRDYVGLLQNEGIEVVRAILYGSRARGDANEEADIDLALIIKNLNRADFELKRNLLRLAVRIDERLEPVAYSPEDFEQDSWLPLLYSIKTTGLDVDISDV